MTVQTNSRIALVGPVYPYRGGISQYLTHLARELGKTHELLMVNFSRQYPSLLFPGRSQEDTSPGALALKSERILDSLDPTSWFKAARRIREFGAGKAIMMWWHPFFGPALGTMMALLARSGIPSLLVCHNVSPHEVSLLDRALTWLAFRKATGFVVHSGEDRRKLEALGVTAPVLQTPLPAFDILASGPARDPVEVRRALSLPQGPILLFFGLIRPYKGLHALLAALPRVLEVREVTLLIVGETYGEKASLEALLDSGHLRPHVRWIDRYVGNDEVPDYFTAADLVVLPYESASQSGVVPIAYQYRRPVVVSRVGGLPEVVFPGETGVLVTPGDPVDLARGIIEALDTDPSLFAAGIERHRELFTWERTRSFLASPG